MSTSALVSTITLGKTGTLTSFDYAANGTVQDFASTAPIQGHAVSGGQISFTASQKGYEATGKAQIDGVDADLKVDGTPTSPPDLLLSRRRSIPRRSRPWASTSRASSARPGALRRPPAR